MSRSVVVGIALAGAGLTLALITGVALLVGIPEGSGPVILSAVGAIGGISASLAGLLRANDAAVNASQATVTAERARQASELTASQAAAVQQAILANCGQLCPSRICPLREREAP